MHENFDELEFIDEEDVTNYIQDGLMQEHGILVKREDIALVLDYYMEFLVTIGVAEFYEDD